MNKLYEEMEQQLARERSELRAEEERKEKKIQREFEMMLQMKDAQMQVNLQMTSQSDYCSAGRKCNEIQIPFLYSKSIQILQKIIFQKCNWLL